MERAFKSKKENENTFKCELLKHLCCFSMTDTGWTKELNIVSWSGGRPVIDIRRWNADHTDMSKGITINYEELIWLYEALTEVMQDEEALALVKSRTLYKDAYPKNKFNAKNSNLSNAEISAKREQARSILKGEIKNNVTKDFYPITIPSREERKKKANNKA